MSVLAYTLLFTEIIVGINFSLVITGKFLTVHALIASILRAGKESFGIVKVNKKLIGEKK